MDPDEPLTFAVELRTAALRDPGKTLGLHGWREIEITIQVDSLLLVSRRTSFHWFPFDLTVFSIGDLLSRSIHKLPTEPKGFPEGLSTDLNRYLIRTGLSIRLCVWRAAQKTMIINKFQSQLFASANQFNEESIIALILFCFPAFSSGRFILFLLIVSRVF